MLSSKIQASSNASEKLYETNTSGKGDLWTDNKLKVGFRTSGPETIWRAAFIRDIMAAAQNWNIELVLSDYAGGKDIDSCLLYTSFCDKIIGKQNNDKGISKEGYRYLIKEREIIDNHFLHLLTIAQIAEQCFLSETKLKQGLKICFNCIVYE